jgi:mono/diheme cytochrome c family protein
MRLRTPHRAAWRRLGALVDFARGAETVKRALLAALLAVLAVGVAGCGTGGLAEGGSVSRGQQLFKDNCGTCHTLAHAGTTGTIGPNLDAAFQTAHDEDYKESTIREVVAKQIKYPTTDPPTGEPGMPANIVKGDDVDDVAAYVACAAGVSKESAQSCGQAAGDGTTTGGGGGSTDGKSLFASAGCGSCHTLKAANATGTVGPNLDQSTITEAAEVKQIENGGGGMPAFKDQLSKAQIEALAKFVVSSRAK